ncbi:hypothetical protein A3A71_00595 [Candidatus Berkelbacteria bacterium RIFCSPLOWO2_01_FULL_50_28]|uniref:DUF5673 domain-containing protein n=1 Tax=Candidatus Berkelbacteria bacterium RIFCSPLOWO2_01_FULL_50_28 TaxID=1797471 RepID=A0A1F5EB69_9BACT|nr:MAG: hypothetical protein A2807_00340 [Candidatus Berkelbacteria bacterium RIFCSPHIGHO2_01_FULL_50_36]OGD63860.1 MAG: hypothetical protein A3F39_03415 [Candidatus Berkelbacteria bacterium RIFCSPHIGHO2_12_FULL_50_11]OGD64540.1 MAG: hypothetical protein A3A71_00595 [Candidatus Berkelbacteria bacterium RIFCSPLOWO2_01_FULL_50_28]
MVKHHEEKKAASSTKRTDLVFEGPEFVHYAKDHLWYIGIVLLAAGFFFLALKYQDYLTALVVLAATVAIFRLANLKPKSRTVRVGERGVTWGDQVLPYHQLKAFWLSENDGHAVVYLERLNFAPTIQFTLPEGKGRTVLEVLSAELPYHEHRGEPLSDRLGRLLRL